MAFLKLGCIKERKTGTKTAGLFYAINYIFNPAKTEDNKYIDFYSPDADNLFVSTENVYNKMLNTKNHYGKPDGRQAYHYMLSFPATDNVTPELAMLITEEFIKTCFYEYEVAYSVHTNTTHIHSHIVLNSVNYFDGLKYQYNDGDWKRYLQPKANEICEKYGLSGLNLGISDEITFKHYKNYGEWKKDNPDKVKSENEYTNAMIMRDIDECIEKATTYEQFKQLMSDKGHILNDAPNHKYITVKAPGRTKNCRIVNLTPDKSTYTKENIIKMIEGTYKKMDREEIRKRLAADMKSFFASGALININGSYKKVNIFDVSAFIEKNNIKTPAAADRYLEYLDAADYELNVMRKKVTKNLNAKADAINDVREIIALYSSYERYKNGDERFKDEYDKVISLYNNLKERGYDINTLYKVNLEGEKCVEEINEYKKQIYLQKKVCQQTKKILASNETIIPDAKKKSL